jgi:hypothetical protein
MTRITRRDDRAGLDGFPAEFTPVGHDDLGDVLAVDAKGRVLVFAHGMGDWNRRLPAFASLAQLERYVAFQDRLRAPDDDEDLATLQQRKREVEAFGKEMRGAAYAREEVRALLADLREHIADWRWHASKAGRALAHRRQVSAACEQALRAAAADDRWMVRPHVDQDDAVCVVGDFTGAWREARVRELLLPVAGALAIVCRQWPVAR